MVPTTPQIWLETYVSSMLRSIVSDSTTQEGLRRIDPFPRGAEDETRFLEVCRGIFWDGWQLGTRFGSRNCADSINNRLAEGLLAYFLKSQRPKAGFEFFSLLAKQRDDKLLAGLQTICLLAMDKESEAVKLLHKTLTEEPNLAPLLRIQFDYLLEKGELKWAETLIKQAIKLAPMDLDGWARLARLQICKGDYDQALITLNSFPYISSTSSVKIAMPYKTFWQPRRDLGALDLSLIESANQLAAPLKTLRSSNLQGTPKVAYELLVEINKKAGWDRLLKTRTEIFVMEEDFVLSRSNSTDPLVADKQDLLDGKVKLSLSDDIQPPPAVKLHDKSEASSPKLKQKRLCERWLDSLFSILYEDIHVLSILRADLEDAKTFAQPYTRTPREWITIGDLYTRLGLLDEAKDAYERSIDVGYIQEAWEALLAMWAAEGRLSHALTALSHLLVDAANKYIDTILPMDTIGVQAALLVRKFGLDRVMDAMETMKLTDVARSAINQYFDQLKASNCIGSDY